MTLGILLSTQEEGKIAAGSLTSVMTFPPHDSAQFLGRSEEATALGQRTNPMECIYGSFCGVNATGGKRYLSVQPPSNS